MIDASEDRPALRAWYILALMIVSTIFGVVDRQVLVVMAEAIKHDLTLSDGQLGLIQGFGPGLVAAVGVLFLGWLTDRVPRQLILAACVLGWSIATAACGAARGFEDLLICGVAIGLGEAALGPILYSVIPDIFPGRSRVTANLIFFGAAMVGGGLGIGLAGWSSALVETWRAALPSGLADLAAWRIVFLLVALPGAPLALAIALSGSIPRHLAPVRNVVQEKLGPYARRNAVTLGGLFAAFALAGVAQYAIFGWMPIYFVRVLQASPEQVGTGFGLAIMCGSVAGIVGAGVAARRLTPRYGAIAPLRVYGIAMACATLPTLGQLFVTSPVPAYLLTALQVASVMTATSLVSTVLQDLCPARIRGRFVATATMLLSLMTGVGPIVVGFVSDLMASDPRGLLWAIVTVAVSGFVAAALCIRAVDAATRRTLAEVAAGAER